MPWQILIFISVLTMTIGQYLMKKLVGVLHPFVIMFYQYLSSIFLILVYHSFIYPQNVMTLASYPFLGIGVMFAIGVSAYYQAMRYSLSKSTLAFSFSDLLTILLAVIFLGEFALINPMTLQGVKTLAGLVLATCSVWFLKGGKNG